MARLPSIREVIRGTLIRYRLTCGKKQCRCHVSKRHRHGPYWYVAVSEKGKKKMVLIPQEHLATVRKGISVYAKLWEGLCRVSTLNLALLKAPVPRPGARRGRRRITSRHT